MSKRSLSLAVLLCAAGLPAVEAAPPVQVAAAAPSSAPAADPYLWLEDVTGERALNYVKTENALTRQELQQRPEFESIRKRLTEIYDSRDRIPYVTKLGRWYYNFWRDEQHPRGVWRRTTLDEYRKAAPAWQVVLDVDALAAREKENWVWKGVSCLKPEYRRCLVEFSRGGGDAGVVREFDAVTRKFVDDGFQLPEAKSDVAWVDRNTIFVATDFGAGSMTDSGYPRVVKRWKRGTPLARAVEVYAGQKADMSVSAYKDFTKGYAREFVYRRTSFWNSEVHWRDGEALRKLPKPDDADFFALRDRAVLRLRSAWTIGGTTYPAGALLAAPFSAFARGEAGAGQPFELIFAAGERESLVDVTEVKGKLLLNVLDNVRNRLYEMVPGKRGWERRRVDIPEFGTVGVTAVDSDQSDDYFVTSADFLNPTTLSLGRFGSDRREELKQLPAFFDTAGLVVEQYEAVSKDGTRVPYFVAMRGDLPRNGENPTLLYGYGGYERAMLPYYSGTIGSAWLNHGGVYVLSNIRGGGEFGPKWHQAALREGRQKSFDDFIAIAEDLAARKITSPHHLGIMGGSNGGLLVSAVMVQRPDLFKAVVSQVPLTDMQRFHQMLAGASWMGEFGNPDKPEDWAYLSKYSPYHNLRPEQRYPRVLFTTSTRDDRVHPGHARKMFAKMKDMGHNVLYFENTEGGHEGAANNQQHALVWALTYTFLLNELK